MYTWLLNALQAEYETVRLIKESSRGCVRLIQHCRTGQQFILRQFSGNGALYQQLMQFQCRNIPQIFEVAHGEDTLVIEEFIKGDSLGFLLKGALFTAAETRKIVFQLCQALWVLQSVGAVHRDIKPENVILRGKEAVLIDFDAARIQKPWTEADTQILGTVGFAAPEQYGLSQTDFHTDIYALGILMNIMLTGEHPTRRLARGPLGRVVERCTRINPEKRSGRPAAGGNSPSIWRRRW